MQHQNDRLLELPKSIAALGTTRFEETLIDELSGISTDLSLERMCTEGGWPDDDTLAMSMASMRQLNGRTYVNVKCKFDEVLSSGCADISRLETGYGEIEIIIDPIVGVAYVRLED